MCYYSALCIPESFIAFAKTGEDLKRYFLDFHCIVKILTVKLATGQARIHEYEIDDWVVHLIDTGLETNTGGRLKRLQPWLEDGTFMLTYGDGLCNVDLRALLDFHRQKGMTGTLTAVRPPARFGALHFEGDTVTQFMEKPDIGEGWVNGGFMCFEPGIFDYIEGDGDSLEAEALERLAADGKLVAYRHGEFWQCMDTLRDVRMLDGLWLNGKAPWKVWP